MDKASGSFPLKQNSWALYLETLEIICHALSPRLLAAQTFRHYAVDRLVLDRGSRLDVAALLSLQTSSKIMQILHVIK